MIQRIKELKQQQKQQQQQQQYNKSSGKWLYCEPAE